MNSQNIAAIVVHMQNAFIEEVSEELRKPMYESQLEVLQAFANKDMPIYTLELLPKENYDLSVPTVPELIRIAEKSDKYRNIAETEADVFANTNLGETIRKQGTQTLLFMGVWECCCVYHNVTSALNLGFDAKTSEHLMANPAYIKRNKEPWFKTNNTLIDYRTILNNL